MELLPQEMYFCSKDYGTQSEVILKKKSSVLARARCVSNFITGYEKYTLFFSLL